MSQIEVAGIHPVDSSNQAVRAHNGALNTRDWRQELVDRGYGWIVNVGAFSTPITGGGAGTVLDLDQPEAILSIPTAYCLIPIRFQVQCHVPLLATDADESEILIAVDRAAAAVDDGTKTAETPLGLRTDISSGCPITATSAYTADVTDPVLGIELAAARITGDVQGTAATALWTGLSINYAPNPAPIIMGPAMVVVYWGGTVATPGFAQLEFIAVAKTLFSTLS